jgi:hypothetical protein
MKALLLIAPVVVLCIITLFAGYYGHPYETCSKKYTSHEDIGECIYLIKKGG